MKADTLKAILIPAVLILIVLAVYFFVFRGTTGTGLARANQEIAVAEKEILDLLAELRSIQLNDELFASPVFQSLKDYSLELVPLPTGRFNPFAPLGAPEDTSNPDSE